MAPSRSILFLSGDAAGLSPPELGELLPAGIEAIFADPNDRDSVARAAPLADAIIVGDAAVDARLLARAERCVAIAHRGPGPGAIDLEAAREAGVVVTSIPDGATQEYAASTIGLLEAFVGPLEKWAGGLEHRPRRLGIVGLGCVGRAVASLARAGGMEVWATDPFAKPETFERCRVRPVPLPDLLGSSDAVALTLPLGPATAGLIGRSELELLRRDAYLVNPSHPALIELEPLFDVLSSRRLAGAAWNQPARDPPRWTLAEVKSIEFLIMRGKIIRTEDDHLATPEVLARSAAMALRIVSDYILKGSEIAHVLIDPPRPRVLLG